VVSATNKDIELLVEKERFRKDLYFRLCVVKANIPSLNDRRDDILPLAKHFLYEFSRKFEKKIKGFEKAAETELLAHSFTGNVRELKNIIERAVLISQTSHIAAGRPGIVKRQSRSTSG
jgi:two-component system response regulator AtoC